MLLRWRLGLRLLLLRMRCRRSCRWHLGSGSLSWLGSCGGRSCLTSRCVHGGVDGMSGRRWSLRRMHLYWRIRWTVFPARSSDSSRRLVGMSRLRMWLTWAVLYARLAELLGPLILDGLLLLPEFGQEFVTFTVNPLGGQLPILKLLRLLPGHVSCALSLGNLLAQLSDTGAPDLLFLKRNPVSQSGFGKPLRHLLRRDIERGKELDAVDLLLNLRE